MGVKHKKRRARWPLYALVGLGFGVADYYFEKSSHAEWLAYAFFLVPALPMAAAEFFVSKKKWKAGLADALVWSAAIVTFYLYELVEQVFIGKPSREEMHISHFHEPWWRGNVISLFRGEVLSGIAEWIGVALVGGFIGGVCVSLALSLALRLMKRKRPGGASE